LGLNGSSSDVEISVNVKTLPSGANGLASSTPWISTRNVPAGEAWQNTGS
jgi:hypothetical protein